MKHTEAREHLTKLLNNFRVSIDDHVAEISRAEAELSQMKDELERCRLQEKQINDTLMFLENTAD